MPPIKCEISLNLSRNQNCVLTNKVLRNEPNPQTNPTVVGINDPIGGVVDITDCKLYVHVVTLSEGFKRSIKWNKYMSQMSKQTRNNNLNYLID